MAHDAENAVIRRAKLKPDTIGNIMLRFLLDTNILVAGLSSASGASYFLLEAVTKRKISIVPSTAVWLEYEAVLKRDSIQALHGFDAAEVDQFLSALAVWVEPITLHYLWRPQLRDANDEMILEAAVNGGVDALITHNIRDFAMAAQRFNLNVMTPQQAVLMLKRRV